MQNYFGDFTCWQDVKSAYATDTAEPEKVYYAEYEIDGYEGSSEVFYRDKGKYYIVAGSHCSCYGLEDQFKPEVYETKELLIAVLERRNDAAAKHVLAALENEVTLHIGGRSARCINLDD